jgi:GlpG protein
MKNKRVKIVLNAPVILAFAALCLIVTLLGIQSGGRILHNYFTTYRASLSSFWTYFRAFSHVLGHSGWAHFANNMCYILLLGPMLEEKYGGKRIVGVILITALATAVINFIFFPSVGILGASGVVFAFILLTSFTGFGSGEIPITFILVAAIYLGQEIINGLIGADNISQMAHIIGGAVGALAGWNWNRR